MNGVTTLIEKYQGLIKAETNYLASPEGQAAPEDQRIFATQKAFFYQGFVDELEKAIKSDRIIEEYAEQWADKMNPVSRGSDSWAQDKESFIEGTKF